MVGYTRKLENIKLLEKKERNIKRGTICSLVGPYGSKRGD